MSVRVGCCGFPKARAEYYRTFEVVEVQRTFYRPPKIETVRRWRAEAPEGFAFAIKAWQRITHPGRSPTYRRDPLPEHVRREVGFFRPTEAVRQAWEVTRAVAEALEASWIIFQCPASFRPTPENLAHLRAFFHSVERGPWRFGWEPRGDWPAETVRELCRELDLVHVVDPFIQPAQWGRPVYWRLHGRGGYAYRYTEADLAQLSAWAQGLDEVWVMFNNVSMWEDALRFRQQLSSGPLEANGIMKP